MDSTWVAVHKIRHANAIARILKAQSWEAKTFNSANDSNTARASRVNSEGEVVLGISQFVPVHGKLFRSPSPPMSSAQPKRWLSYRLRPNHHFQCHLLYHISLMAA
jgi:hypothetical protein